MPQFSGVIDVMVVDEAVRSYKAHLEAPTQESAIEKAILAVERHINLIRAHAFIPRAWTELVVDSDVDLVEIV